MEVKDEVFDIKEEIFEFEEVKRVRRLREKVADVKKLIKVYVNVLEVKNKGFGGQGGGGSWF